MNVAEAVDSRISCRGFRPDPVDPETLREMLELSARAASGGNLQPWRVYALTGSALEELKRVVAEEMETHDPRHIDAEYPIYPKELWEPYKGHREYHGVQLYGALQIDRGDMEGRVRQYKENYKFFNAPVGLLITVDRRLGPGQFTDLGNYITTFMLLAREKGLDTCAQESWARAYRSIGKFLNIPAEQMLFCGVAVGYRDETHAANSFRSPRAPVEEFCRFIGFDDAKASAAE
jgi:nitroreductase